MNLLEFTQKFATEEACLAHLENARWGANGKDRFCPHCGSYKTYKFSNGKLFKCGDCRKQFTVKVGTIFSDSKIPLTKWYLAIYLASSLKKGVSSVQVSKYTGVTQKSAWFMLHRIRTAFESNGNGNLLRGTVEIDETYVGGKAANRAFRKPQPKATVFGVVERHGAAYIKHVKSSGSRVLLPEIAKTVEPGAQIYTDQWQAYKTLGRRGYSHGVVNHGERQYVVGARHTQTVEGLWSQFKRSIYGVYHHVSVKHLQRYCSETEYRYNTRALTDGERFEHWFGRVAGRLTYKELVNG
ncbi:MAG TPA: IS1595 family transposase [Candidatus Saccharimonadales bacterium]|nr:IS1595 family transposase [Candidatus Saccharimonadales bacterium]